MGRLRLFGLPVRRVPRHLLRKQRGLRRRCPVARGRPNQVGGNRAIVTSCAQLRATLDEAAAILFRRFGRREISLRYNAE